MDWKIIFKILLMEQEIEKFKSEVIKINQRIKEFETQNIVLKRNKLNTLIENPNFWGDRKKLKKY